MTINTNLKGRLRNTALSDSNALLPVFEAVVNSIHAVESSEAGMIQLELIRDQSQASLELGNTENNAELVGFRIIDNGIGFDDVNMISFETLDSEHKAAQGCRGVGRLLWLKAFDEVRIISVFHSGNKKLKRHLDFAESSGVTGLSLEEVTDSISTTVSLSRIKTRYQKKMPKAANVIAQRLLEHCLWYFVRQGGAPKIEVKDGSNKIELDELYQQLMLSEAKGQKININGFEFELIHLRLRASKDPHVSWCAAGCVVQEENLRGKIDGLYGKLSSDAGEFTYACYVTSDFLDQSVRSERTSFDIKARSDLLEDDLSFERIESEVLKAIEEHLAKHLEDNKAEGKNRVETYVNQKAPRFRPLLAQMKKLSVDPKITDKKLELVLHQRLAEIEGELIEDGQKLDLVDNTESLDYQVQLSNYLKKVEGFKQSDLASYVFHRKNVLNHFKKALTKDSTGKYAREELLHQLIVPLRKTSNDVRFDSCNFWLIDERLAFHDFLASDKPISKMPAFSSSDNKEPDIIVLKVFDEPILLNDGKTVPLSSIVVVEIKRPMRDDAKQGEDKDPIEQALGYLKRVRSGEVRTSSGRPIPKSTDIPGFCYVICDITPSIKNRCELLNLQVTEDHLGFFGFNSVFKAYIEVISFDRLVNAAEQRNRAFFDKLGLPTS
jgi:hypothetical protein